MSPFLVRGLATDGASFYFTLPVRESDIWIMDLLEADD